jgi:hydrogenase maturation protease
MPPVLIIGYGNPLRSDDGIGWRAADEIARECSASDIRVVRLQQLLPEIAEDASRANLAVFIDARQGGTPGEITCEVLESNTTTAPAYSHDLSPASVLRLAEQLYGKRPRAYLITVSGESFTEGDSLSPAVATALPHLIAHIKTLIS